MKIRNNDKVMIISGKDKTKVGKVLKILKSKNKVLVEGLNKVKKHVKPNPYKNEQGGIKDNESPIDISNVKVVCDACTLPTKIGYRYTEDGKKMRYCKKCDENF
ncbi:50S ribosomal protein L24 [Desulfonatronovibrio magnus]|uniref:50S ribosomal protein L24 n=1 Tax=Desulfonatronovibrio magnus TaxID=698827 RepID=UPI0005EBB537|nr:50S ribosomal protein L24 [Desulfonatronovibrio magnus]